MRSSELPNLKLFEMRIESWNFRTTTYGVRSIAFFTSLSAHCALAWGRCGWGAPSDYMAQWEISCSFKPAGQGTSRSSRIIFSWLLKSKDSIIDHTCIFTLRIKSLFLHQTSRVNVCMQLHAYQWRPSLSPNSHESSSQAATAPLEKFYLCVVLINTQGLGFCWQYLLMKQNLETSTWNPLLHAKPELIWLDQLAVGRRCFLM